MSNKPIIFVIQSYGMVSTIVYDLISVASTRVGAHLFRIDSSNTAEDFLESSKDAIRTASLIVADVSSARSSVMFEVGYAQANNKPIIYIASGGREIPFSISGSPVVIYDLAQVDEFIEKLQAAIKKALQSPEDYNKQISCKKLKRQKVFVSYSHVDKPYLDRLMVHLKPLEKEGLVDLWVDTRLRAGDSWEKEIKRALDQATVAILIVSADFLASNFITDNELPPLLRKAEEDGVRILPLIVKPCRFARDKNLSHFHALNDPKLSLALLPQGEQEVLYDQLAAEVERSINRL